MSCVYPHFHKKLVFGPKSYRCDVRKIYSQVFETDKKMRFPNMNVQLLFIILFPNYSRFKS